MNVNDALGLLGASNVATNNAQRAASSSSVQQGSQERNLFMTLLVAQLKNQDPLAPQDGAAFVAQLAQFNSLDQLIGIKQTLDQLLASQRSRPTQTQPPTFESVAKPSSIIP
jgi:flagellar basal-body rod modification protein FlgD